jgi:acetylglutamate kinase
MISVISLRLRAAGSGRIIRGGMIPKVEACVRTVEGGVKKAHIIDGGKPHAILLELLTDEEIWTMIR